MLIVHGIGEHSGRYEHVGRYFADRDIDTMAFDLRGFGQSGGRRAFVTSFDQYLDDVEQLLAERSRLGVPVVLFGHSLGGLVVTTHLVSGRPGPDLAVISAPALEAEVPAWQTVLAPVLGRVLPKQHIPSKIDAELLSRDPAVQQAYVDDPLVIVGATAALGSEIFRTMKATGARLDRVTVPTYVLHGSEDRLVPPAASEPLGRLPNVTRKLWDGLRHECLNEPEQETVMAAIEHWITEQLAT
jgi:acylglycerol lipase